MSVDRPMPPGLCQNSRWEALRYLPLSSVEFAALKELIFRGRRGFSYPSISLIARSTGYSVRSIQRGLKQLEALGLLRRARRVRANGTRGVYCFYLTFSGVTGRAARRHADENPPDTVSVHNLKNKQIKSGRLERVVETEKRVFEILERALALRWKPELIDGSALTEWIYYREAYLDSGLDNFVVDQANQLAALHKKHKTRLQDWQHLLDLVEGKAKTESLAFTQGRIHPKLEHRVVAYLIETYGKKSTLRSNLVQIPKVLSDDDGLILTVGLSADYRVLSQDANLLKGLANAMEMPVRVQFDSLEIEPTYPKGVKE